MYILISFLSKTEKANDLVHKMREHGFTGGTLFDGVGMRKVMPKVFDVPLVASLHSIFEEKGQINKVLFCVLENMEEVKKLSSIIEDVMGDLHKPNTGLIIAFKLDYVKGYDRWKDSDL
ncbi:hypothetical protein J7L05_07940 [bacterium]|nr:hypothetical protein [bacterium]